MTRNEWVKNPESVPGFKRDLIQVAPESGRGLVKPLFAFLVDKGFDMRLVTPAVIAYFGPDNCLVFRYMRKTYRVPVTCDRDPVEMTDEEYALRGYDR